MSKRIVFMGTPDFAVPSLQRLLDQGYTIVGVVTQPDRPKGRGLQMSPSPVKEVSLCYGIPVLEPERLKSSEFMRSFKAMTPDLVVVVAYRILPGEVLAVPRFGTINLHASLLPKYRGPAPINWAIIEGEKETGVTTFWINPGIDTGEIILQRKVEIGDEETAGELYDRLKIIGAKVLTETLELITTGLAQKIPQDETLATRAPKFNKEDGEIDWSQNSVRIVNFVRGTNPFPGAFTYWHGQPLKIHRTAVVREITTALPGSIIKTDPVEGVWVATGSGVVALREIQPSGKRKMSSAEFVRGYPVKVGERLRGRRDKETWGQGDKEKEGGMG